MPDYSKGQIYTVRCYDDKSLIYVGSTVQLLSKRFSAHRKRIEFSLYQYVNEHYAGNWGKWYIELYELYPCNSKQELNKREGEIIREIATINKVIPNRTPKEWRQDNADTIREKKKQYYEANLDTIKEYKKTYRQINADDIKEKKKQYRQDNADALKEKRKQYYQQNVDSITEYQKQYHQNNIEKVKEYQKQYRQNHSDENREYKRLYYLRKKEEKEQKSTEQCHKEQVL